MMDKQDKGITLIALIITIILLIILAAVTMNVLFDTGLIKVASEGVQNYIDAEATENQVMQNVVDYLDSIVASIEGTSGGGTSVTTISTTDSYVGYYADIDGNGTVDGIIYADLMQSASYSEWGNSDGTYSWTVLTESDGVKSYYVSQTSCTDDFGAKAVISPVERNNRKG